MRKMALIYGGAVAIGIAIELWQAIFVCVGIVSVLHGICLLMADDL